MAATASRKAVAGIGLAAVLTLLAAPALADVKAGVDAWTAGDFTRAVVEWQGPAAAGDADALFNLAQAYRLGRGVEVDNARARKLYEEAARLGHVKAADNYGLMLFQEGEQDKAMPLIKAAAERGDPRAQYVLGLSHFNADYAPRDRYDAVRAQGFELADLRQEAIPEWILEQTNAAG
jgi:TPR repeat protein